MFLFLIPISGSILLLVYNLHGDTPVWVKIYVFVLSIIAILVNAIMRIVETYDGKYISSRMYKILVSCGIILDDTRKTQRHLITGAEAHELILIDKV